MSRRLNFNTLSQRTRRRQEQIQPGRNLPKVQMQVFHPIAPRVVESGSKKMPRAFSVRRAPWTRFYYCKSVRGKWHRVERILRGMRWNAYLYYGISTPHFKPVEAPRAPPVVSGVLGALKTTHARELALGEIKAERIMLAKEHREERRLEHSERKKGKRLEHVIEASSHPLFKEHAEEPRGHHQERHESGQLHYPVHHHTPESRTENHRTEIIHHTHQHPEITRVEHAETHHEHHAQKITEERRHAESKAPVPMAVISPAHEHKTALHAFIHTGQYNAPHHRIDDVKVTYHSGHHHAHHHFHHKPAEVLVHHGHQHGHHRSHHSHHGSDYRHRSTRHETYYYFFQQPWTAFLIGMPGRLRNRKFSSPEPKAVKLSAPAALKISTAAPLPADKYALNIKFPRRRFRQPKVTTADAYPP